ncbi:MAG: DASS family sodium-coupled anion symporter [bacterium]|nr:DASS family sodium-coupled anion symporter [bacterium]
MPPRQTVGLLLGFGLFLLMLALPTPDGLNPVAMRAGAVTLLMAVWWMTEALPIFATALVPMVLFPLLGILDAATTATNYGHNYVLMLLGGFFIAKAIEVHNLHRRIALVLITRIGTSRRRIILSFMIATAFLSMWIANVAVTLLMLPIGIAIIAREQEAHENQNSKFGLTLMLAIAHAASIGGTGSLIGTPPNMVFVGMVQTMYPNAPEISFFEWMIIGIPLVLIFLPIMWAFLVRFHRIEGTFLGSDEVIQTELDALGSMSSAEKRVLTIFIFTALGWIFRKDFHLGALTFPGWSSLLGVQDLVHDSTVALLSALLMFLISTGDGSKNRLLTWKAAETVPWGVVLIVGGGYCIAKGFTQTGLAPWIGHELAFISALPIFLVVLLVVLFMTFITEINSNTATANIFLPILATMALAGKVHPFLLMIPGTFACSCAFMLPSGTGPNAVIFGSGQVTIPEMSHTGFWLNLISVVVVTLVMYLIAIPLFGITPELPAWIE